MLVFVSFFEILYLLIFFLILHHIHVLYKGDKSDVQTQSYWSIPDKKFPLGGWKVAKLGDSPT